MTPSPTNVFMIDIETGGIAPGAAILEIAAAEFNLGTGEILREWSVSIDLLDCLGLGLKFEAATAGFHLRNHYPGSLRGSTLWRALNALDVFLHLHSEDVTVWAWGKDFEAKHFEHAWNLLGFTPAWDFRKLHCARDEFTKRLPGQSPRKKKHTAAEDVREQVMDLCEAWNVTTEARHE